MMDTQRLIAGVDEAGRGPLAGPVVAAAVILDPAVSLDGLTDSKKLSPTKREALFVEIQRGAIAWSIGRAEVDEIDAINILQATLQAMRRAVMGLSISPAHVLVDGNRCPNIPYPATAIIGGDLSEPTISAASILAKVSRDREMVALDRLYPGYGFAKHKGYGTKQHIAAIEAQGPCDIHRKTFAPISRLITV